MEYIKQKLLDVATALDTLDIKADNLEERLIEIKTAIKEAADTIYGYNDKQVQVMLDMIHDEEIGNDCKTLYIAELAYAGNISQGKIHELIQSSGIGEHGILVDARYMDEFSRRYLALKGKEK